MLAIDVPAPHRFGHRAARLQKYERRHGGRVGSTGTVILHGEPAIHGRVLDIAVGGLSFRAEGVTWACPEPGAPA